MPDGRARVNRAAKTPFQRVVDDLSGGCGCACHTGTGYRTSCEHCRPHATGSRAATESAVFAAKARLEAAVFAAVGVLTPKGIRSAVDRAIYEMEDHDEDA